MRRILRVPVVAAMAIFMALAGATAASAHNVLESTSPTDGSSVATAPHVVKLTFDKPSESIGTTIQVKGPDGAVSVAKPTLVNTSVSAKVGGKLPAGKYTVNWRVTSADGHPVSGTFSFTTKKGAQYASLGSSAASKSGGSAGDKAASNNNSTSSGSTSSTSQSSGSVGTILIVVGVAVVVVIIIVIVIVTLRRRRPPE